MMRFVALLLAVVVSAPAWGAEGLVAVKSPHDARATMDRLVTLLEQKGMTIFARIDHAAGAAAIGRSLRATELVIFGNPQVGTQLMECSQTTGIDLPLKALVWQDAAGQVWLGYNDPVFLAERHETPQCGVVNNMRNALAGFVQAAVAP
jgi:uncharacterized protein (DUF302 family)